jgi:hypothetical protein
MALPFVGLLTSPEATRQAILPSISLFSLIHQQSFLPPNKNQQFHDCTKVRIVLTLESLIKPNAPRAWDGKPRVFKFALPNHLEGVAELPIISLTIVAKRVHELRV